MIEWKPKDGFPLNNCEIATKKINFGDGVLEEIFLRFNDFDSILFSNSSLTETNHRISTIVYDLRISSR
jgi:hypothetical protein